MELEAIALRYLAAAEALHTVHSSMDVHGYGGITGQAFTEHCALICNDKGVYFDFGSNTIINVEPPHKAVLDEYFLAKSELETFLLKK